MKILKSFQFLALGLGVLSFSAWSQTPNPKTTYMVEGQIVSPWQPVLGDESNWYQPVEGEKATSSNKGISYEKVVDDGKTATQITWNSKKKDAAFTIAGSKTNLSALPKTVGLVIDLKVHNKLRNPLTLSMDCEYPCRGSVNLKPLLDAYPTKEWITLPLPLRCFSQAGTDLSKVNSPLHLQTQGKFKMSIGNVRLVQLPADVPLCQDKQ